MTEREEYRLNERTFCVFLTSVGIITMLGGLLGAVQRKDMVTIGAYFFGSLAAFFCKFLVKTFFQYKSILILFMAITQGVLLPFLFFCEGGIYGPIPIWMALNLIFIFMLFKGRVLSVFCVAVILEYGYLLGRYYQAVAGNSYLDNHRRIFVDFTFVLLSATTWLVLVIVVQEKRHDIEEKSRMESEASVDASIMAKNRFLAGVAVALRKPMTLIIGMTELILKELKDNFIHNEMLRLKTASYDVLSILNDTYNYAELSAGEKVIHEENYHFEDLLNSISKLFTEEVTSSQIRLVMDVDPKLPKVLCGDSRYIKRVFLKLITASAMMTKEGRIHLEISGIKENRGELLTLQCRLYHTGRGLTKEEMASLFGHYEQYALSNSRNLEGIGLKFSVCRAYLKVLGGSITVESLPNVGMDIAFTFQNKIVDAEPICRVDKERAKSVLIYAEDEIEQNGWQKIMEGLMLVPDYVENRYRFEHALRDKKYGFLFLSKKLYESLSAIIAYYHCENETYIIGGAEDAFGDFGQCRLIRTPLYCTKVADVLNGKWRAEEYQFSQNEGSFHVKGGRILVIDDNPVDLKVATGLFAKYGVDIDIAVNGEDGLKKVEASQYHLVITDLFMEHINGIEVLAGIRRIQEERGVKIPVAVITSNLKENIKEEVLAYGFQYFFGKPIQVKSIEECMLLFLPEQVISKQEQKPNFLKEERGLDTRKGLANIGYKEDAYAAILNTYYKENCKKQEQLLEVYKKEELPVFISAVHGIKSASASIGAMGLSMLARELEYAGKDGNLGLIGERLPLFLKEYQLILDEIKDYLLQHGQFLGETVKKEQVVKKQDILDAEKLKVLKDALQRMDLKASGKILEEFGETEFGSSEDESVKAMKEAFDKFDFHTVKEVLNGLLEKI